MPIGTGAALIALTFSLGAARLYAQDRPHALITAVHLTTHEGPRVTVEAEEGWLEVPEWWDDGGGRTIRLHFYRFRSTAEQPGDPIVYLAGGPGGSGSTAAMGDRFPLFQAMRAVGDVIAFDQRGVYGTSPFLVCPNSWDYPLDEPRTHHRAVELEGRWARECARSWEAQGVDLAAYHTRASVADLEALRAALDADRLNLWGISYGTHLGLAYIRQHPNRVHRAVLAGVEGPDHTIKLPSSWERAVAALDSATAADPGAVAAFGRVRPMIDRLVQRFDPPRAVVAEDGREVVIGREDVLLTILNAFSEREDYIEIPMRLHQILQGNEAMLAERVADARTTRRGLAMTAVVDCASGISPQRLARVEREAAVSWLGEATLSTDPWVCEAWPHVDLGPDFRAPIESAVPVLFVSGTLDARTPPANAEEVLLGFPNGRHLVIEGAGHDDDLLLSDPGIVEAMIGFLGSGAEPPRRIVLPPLDVQTP
jgi:pimeloyl-ACP methyl ester carboxylesterase